MRVLLIEDDPMVGKALAQALRDEGMAVDWVRDGHDAEAALRNPGHVLVLLDLGLPGKSGIALLRALRARGDATPVLIITARDDLDDRVEGLDLGADDYVVKPFEIRELMARMRAVLRRRHGGQAVSALVCGELVLDLETHRVSYREAAHVLPAREFALMRALSERPGAILSRAQLEERLYGWGEEVESNAVDVLIHYVRRKFGKDVIRNVRGAGWMIAKGSS
ncbi:response regulator transcription factor [Labrys wisconsinensis]|uniref:DNA-binding response OmpR family regulator n=1 Tax=Labrys wisconsinensis TaxID=425677 RepID=A0ABU0JGP6_9HYPH|nr:response regulator transcription factor [Labrys wisconsinensis]MDQ0472307.1 DNA-binding response OmpR family regulator [Labrys wisconsinensis]